MESYAESLLAAAQLPVDEPTSPLLLARRHGVHVGFSSRLGVPVSWIRSAQTLEPHSILLNSALGPAETAAACALAFATLRSRAFDPESLGLALLLPRPAFTKYAAEFNYSESMLCAYFNAPAAAVVSRVFALRLPAPLQSARRMRVVPAVNDSEHLVASSSR